MRNFFKKWDFRVATVCCVWISSFLWCMPIYAESEQRQTDSIIANQNKFHLANLLREISGGPDSGRVIEENVTLPEIYGLSFPRMGFVFKTSIHSLDHQLITVGKLYADQNRPYFSKQSIYLLQEIAQLLEVHREGALRIEAQCDDRGTEAYSFILANKYIWKLKQFIHDVGFPLSKIETISYGEESPFCSDSFAVCKRENIRTYETFRLLSISHPRNGCLVGFNVMVEPHFSIQSRAIDPKQFLLRLRLAEVRRP